MNPMKKAWYVFRDAITGRFVTAQDAKRRPRTTVRERLRRK